MRYYQISSIDLIFYAYVCSIWCAKLAYIIVHKPNLDIHRRKSFKPPGRPAVSGPSTIYYISIWPIQRISLFKLQLLVQKGKVRACCQRHLANHTLRYIRVLYIFIYICERESNNGIVCSVCRKNSCIALDIYLARWSRLIFTILCILYVYSIYSRSLLGAISNNAISNIHNVMRMPGP